MTFSVSGTGAANPPSGGHHRISERREAVRDLVKDIRSGDLDGAKAAYATLTKNVPAAVLANPNSALGQLGAALQAGDAGAAKAALGKVAVKLHQYRDAPPVNTVEPIVVPVSAPPAS